MTPLRQAEDRAIRSDPARCHNRQAPCDKENEMPHASQQAPVTMINVFAVEPHNQQALVDLLTRATDEVISKQAGYLSARIHRSLDGRRAAVYARWRSAEDFLALAENRDAAAHMHRARTLASFEPVLYDVVLSHDLVRARDQPLAG
jgi:heme-degrading monooxygenase HmoA